MNVPKSNYLIPKTFNQAGNPEGIAMTVNPERFKEGTLGSMIVELERARGKIIEPIDFPIIGSTSSVPEKQVHYTVPASSESSFSVSPRSQEVGILGKLAAAVDNALNTKTEPVDPFAKPKLDING